MISSFATIIGILSRYFGFSSTQVSIFGLIFIVAGMIGSVIHSALIDKFQRHKLQLIVISYSSLSSTIIVLFFFKEGIIAADLVLAYMGFVVLPIIPISFNTACKITYPIG